jgi:hypothetical protein
LRILNSFSLLIVIIIIIIICYDFHAGYLQIYRKHTMSLGYIDMQLFCIYNIYATYNVISDVKYFVLLHLYF